MGLKRRTWILLGCVGFLGLISICTFVGLLLTFDEGDTLTTNTHSEQLKTSAERIAFLGRYLKMRTTITDAAFHIAYQDNSHGIPGPSDWSIVAAVQVTPNDSAAWLTGAEPVDPKDSASGSLPQRSIGLIPSGWRVSSPGESYSRGGALLIWHSEGVLEFSAKTD